MTSVVYEYRAIPAPQKGKRARGAKTAQDRFCIGLQDLMNEMAVEGWEYHRAETLPFEERSRMGRKTTGFHSVLIFRRALIDETISVAETYVATPAPIAAPEPMAAARTVEPHVSGANEAAAGLDDQASSEDAVPELQASRPEWVKDGGR